MNPSEKLQSEVLGGIIMFSSKMYPHVKTLLPSQVFNGVYRKVYDRFIELSDRFYNEGGFVDIIILSKDLEENPIENKGGDKIGAYWLTGLSQDVFGVVHLSSLIAALRRDLIKRRTITTLKRTIQTVSNGDLDTVLIDYRKLSDEISSKSNSYDHEKTIRALIKELDGGITPGIKTGFGYLDKMLGGLQSGNLIVLAGRTSQGKTTMAINIARNIAYAGRKVLYISIEMTTKEILTKIISLDTGVPSEKIRSGWLTKDQMLILKDDSQKYYSTKTLTILDDINTLDGVHESIITYKPEVVFVDFIQYMKFQRAESRVYEIEEVMKGLKSMAKLENAVIIVLSQVNRGSEKKSNRLPNLEHLKGSGSIEENGDSVLFIHWPYFYDENAEKNKSILNVAKNRHGETGIVSLTFDPDTGKYDDNYSLSDIQSDE